MTVAPQNPYPEQQQGVFERTMAPSIPGNRGPLRFQEGIQTDTDVPNDFVRGAYGDTAPNGRFSHPSREMFYKWPEESISGTIDYRWISVKSHLFLSPKKALVRAI